MSSPVFEPLNQFIDFSQLNCLNEADNHKAKDFFRAQTDGIVGKQLESDVDEQLLLTIPFLKTVKINSLIIQGPDDFAPSHIKLFINQMSYDFSNAEKNAAVQEIILKKDETKDGKSIQLKFVKFQNIFVSKNHGGGDKTIINKFVMIGQEIKVEGTKMDASAAPKNSRVSSTDVMDAYH